MQIALSVRMFMEGMMSWAFLRATAMATSSALLIVCLIGLDLTSIFMVLSPGNTNAAPSVGWPVMRDSSV